MKTKILFLILSFSFFLMSSYAFATTESGSINLNNINWDLTDLGLPVAPYGANFVIGNTSFQGNLACLDINLSTYVNTTYSGTWYTANLFPSESGQYAALNEVGWLANQLYGLTPQNVSSSNIPYGSIDLAIWTIMLPYSTDPSTTAPDGALLLTTAAESATSGWISSAETAVTDGYTTTDLFFSPSDTTSQGYVLLEPNPLTPTPEPSTFLLYGAGFAGVVYMKRRMKA